MSGDLEERMGQLCDELQQALDAGASIDTQKLAERFAIPEPDVQSALQALAAMHDAIGQDDAAGQHELAPPQLSDDYEVLDELGRGGMGIVYRAHQRSLDRDLAVKVLRPGDLMFGDAIRRFEREAKSLARLRHRHIVSVHEVGKADGFVYFTMDLIDGCTLAERLENGAMPTTQAVKLLLQLSSAMAYAHGKGVMHRDLKPGNVLLDANGDGFVCDFGLARELGGEVAATMTGQMLGTPAYMSPEQALGDRQRIGEPTDVYALGAILYECLSGKAPFAGLPLAQLMNAVIERDPMPLRKRNPRVRIDLQVICEKAMHKDPEQRYATVQAFAEDLERFSIGKPILARSASTLEQGWRALRRNRRAVLRTLIPVAALLALAWLFVLPSVMRGRTAALAERMRTAGSLQGEVAAYEEIYADVHADSIPGWHRVRYLRACVDEAARLWVHGSDEQQERANVLHREAFRLLGAPEEHRHWLELSGTDPELADAFRVQFVRLAPWTDKYRDGAWFFDLNRVLRQMPAEPAGLGRCADQIRIAASLPEFGMSSEPWTPRQRDAVLALLPVSERLPAAMRDRIRSTCRFSLTPIYKYVDQQVLTRLVEIAADPSLHFESRRNAAGLFHHAGWLPFLTEERQFATSQGQRVELAIGEQDLAWLVATWKRLQTLPKLEQYMARIRAVLERYQAATRRGSLCNASRAALTSWLRDHTGHLRIEAEDFAVWMQQHGDEDPRDFLLAALRWHIPAEDLTVDAILDRFDSLHQAPAHHLLELTVADDVRVPDRSMMSTPQTTARWLTELGRRNQYRRRLRLATFVIQDGAVAPQILHQQQQVLVIDEDVQWQVPMPTELPFTAAHLGEAMPAHYTRRHDPLLLIGTARSFQNGGRLLLRATCQMQGRIPYGVWPRGYDGDREANEGVVAFVGGAYWTSQQESARYTWFTLATLQPTSEPDAPWSVEQWQAAIAAGIERISTDRILAVNNAKHLAAASFLPTDVQPEVWQRLHGRFEERSTMHGDYCQKHRAAARMLSGDEAALELDVGEPQGHGREFLDHSFFVRLAATTDSDKLRAHAFAQLGSQPLGLDLLRTLENHRQRLQPLPAALAQQLVDLPSPGTAMLRDNLGKLALLTTHVLLLALATWRMFRGGRVGRAAAIGAIALGLLLTHWGIYVGDRDLNPFWLGHTLAALGVWALCWRSTHGPGWLIIAVLWTGTATAYVTGNLDHPTPAWIVTTIALLSLPMHRDYIHLDKPVARVVANRPI